jgi:hypothetical protein
LEFSADRSAIAGLYAASATGERAIPAGSMGEVHRGGGCYIEMYSFIFDFDVVLYKIIFE